MKECSNCQSFNRVGAKEKNFQALETIGKFEELFDNQELRNVFTRNAVHELQHQAKKFG